MSANRIKPGPAQESVWDYPRPPRLQVCPKRIQVLVGSTTIADSHRTFRVLETSHPPVYYIPPEDILLERLVPVAKQSWDSNSQTALAILRQP